MLRRLFTAATLVATLAFVSGCGEDTAFPTGPDTNVPNPPNPPNPPDPPDDPNMSCESTTPGADGNRVSRQEVQDAYIDNGVLYLKWAFLRPEDEAYVHYFGHRGENSVADSLLTYEGNGWWSANVPDPNEFPEWNPWVWRDCSMFGGWIKVWSLIMSNSGDNFPEGGVHCHGAEGCAYCIVCGGEPNSIPPSDPDPTPSGGCPECPPEIYTNVGPPSRFERIGPRQLVWYGPYPELWAWSSTDSTVGGAPIVTQLDACYYYADFDNLAPQIDLCNARNRLAQCGKELWNHVVADSLGDGLKEYTDPKTRQGAVQFDTWTGILSTEPGSVTLLDIGVRK